MPHCHMRSHCFIAIHHYRYDGLYCQCSPRLRHTLTICFALYCFFHLKQVIQNLFFLVSKYTLAISLNDFMWIKTRFYLPGRIFPVLFSHDWKHFHLSPSFMWTFSAHCRYIANNLWFPMLLQNQVIFCLPIFWLSFHAFFCCSWQFLAPMRAQWLVPFAI